MELKELKPKKALNKAFLKVKPNRADIENFKTNLIALLDKINDTESEEFHKNLVSDFLKDTYYKQNHFINTKGKNDLVIHNGNTANTSVGVIIEAKKTTNKSEMITTQKLNAKAFQELVLYYLRERITHKNLAIKHLVATNINEWFIFDATVFDRLFAQNKNFVKQFNDFEDGRLADTKTDFFYKQIAQPFIADISTEIEFTYFNIQDYQKPLRNANKEDDNALIALFKLLSPEHLLKLPFTNDSNSLDKRFYSELLHIIGLTETKEGGKKLIGRNKEGERHSGTILEEAIIQLDSLDKLNRIEKPSQFGNTQQERLFNIALELSITWINRILFLKLLEAQLITYHKGDKSYSFLNLDKIKGYDDLNGLFFQVLARKHEERNEDIKKVFDKVPYLNSSLFEPTDMEQLTLFISNLKDDKTIPIISSTVLKDQQGKKRTGNLNTLEYLFEFLNAYDFGSEGSEDIQEDNKTLISASVLGLIFEKINGYKDGSFFTPGFITMYMCRETIRKAVVQKFDQNYPDFEISRIEDIYELIPQKISRKQANQVVNSIKICDPAVGSGHFLVSALNEMIAVKNDLKILEDREGKSLHRYEVEVLNDELIVTDEEGELFEYNPNNKESQRIQETIFHEKQTIIENCLFGVDINTNSVKICRLRLWIELLKNAYYKAPSPLERAGGEALETLPNIDINIKCGNSLVSRFAIDADLKQALKKSKWTIDSYRIAVDTYRNAENKEQKREMERLIADIKSDFRSEIEKPFTKKISEVRGKAENLATKILNLKSFGEQIDKKLFDEHQKTAELFAKLEAEREEIKTNKIFENAFEWRFEFPEVLNDEGDFVGFDVVIGNPPYIQLQAMKDVSEQLKQFNYQTYEKTGDIYALFYEKGNTILKHNGYLAYITSNKWMRAGYGKTTRNYFLQHTQPQLLIDLGSGIFEEATVDSNILIFKKQPYQQPFAALDISKEKNTTNLQVFSDKMRTISPQYDQSWTIASPLEQSIKAKIEQIGKPLKDWDINIYRGILTGFNEAFIIDGKKKDELIAQDSKSAEIIKPILRGRDIKRYKAEFADLWLINIPKGFTIKGKNNKIVETNIVSEPMPRYGFYEIDEAWSWFEQKLPAIAKYLNPFKEKAKKRLDMGDYWWELRACTYLNEFEKEKIVWNRIASEKVFSFVENGIYISDSMHFFTGENLVFLNCILNSKLYSWFLNLIVGIAAGGNAGNSSNVKDLHVLKLSEAEQAPFIALVEQILLKKEQGEDTKDLETQIDRLVYELYDLTEEEIKIIEAS
jgi:type II restriction/modification system DNA methylase subunit YeeA